MHPDIPTHYLHDKVLVLLNSEVFIRIGPKSLEDTVGPGSAFFFQEVSGMSGRTITLDGLSLKLDDIVRVARHGDTVRLGDEAIRAVKKAAALVER